MLRPDGHPNTLDRQRCSRPQHGWTLIHDIGANGGEGMEVSNKVRGVTYERNVARITVRAVPDQPGVAISLRRPG